MKNLIIIWFFVLPFTVGAQEWFVTTSAAPAIFNNGGVIRSGGRFNITAIRHWDWENEMTGVFLGAGLGYMQFNRPSGPIKTNSLAAIAGVSAEEQSVFVGGKLSYYWSLRSSARPLRAFSPALVVTVNPLEWKRFNVVIEAEAGLFDGTGYVSPTVGIAWNLDKREKETKSFY